MNEFLDFSTKFCDERTINEYKLISEKSENVKKEQNYINRCLNCNKKIQLIPFECKCGNIYCSKHRFDHNCSFDYKKYNQEKLKNKLVRIESQKIEKI